MHWQTSRFLIDLDQPRVMGIVNVTPDSFSDGGHHANARAACAHCDQLLDEGAHLLDIGAESTRPGAAPLPVEEELARIIPVLRYAVRLGVPVSVDTYKPAVMQVALDLGVDIINDVWSLRWQGRDDPRNGVRVVADHPQCGICLMHMHGDPQTMQSTPMAGDVLPSVCDFLAQQARVLEHAGVQRARICLDPGIGFGKTVAQNFSLLAQQNLLSRLGYPVLAGWSRKSSLAAAVLASRAPRQAGAPGTQTVDVSQRLAASVAAALLAVQNGAAVVRVHDVRSTCDALAVLAAAQQAGSVQQ